MNPEFATEDGEPIFFDNKENLPFNTGDRVWFAYFQSAGNDTEQIKLFIKQLNWHEQTGNKEEVKNLLKGVEFEVFQAEILGYAYNAGLIEEKDHIKLAIRVIKVFSWNMNHAIARENQITTFHWHYAVFGEFLRTKRHALRALGVNFKERFNFR